MTLSTFTVKILQEIFFQKKEKGNQLMRFIISFPDCPGGTYTLFRHKTREEFLLKIFFNLFGIPEADGFTFFVARDSNRSN